MWMNEQDVDRAVRVLEDYAPEAAPYARYLSEWRDRVKRAGGRWDVASPGAAGARDLMILLDRAGRSVRLKGSMPTDGEFRAALDPVRATALRFGLEAPVLAGHDRAPAGHRDSSAHSDPLWTADIDAFVGRAEFIGGNWEFDGRADGTGSEFAEDYTGIWEWDDFGRTLWTGTREGPGYTVVELRDFEPPTVVLRTGAETVGFYMDAMCWIDPPHRGRGLSLDLIRGGVALLGRVPDLNGVGFSDAGLRAHEAAHRESVREAILRGDLDDGRVPPGP